LHFLRTEGFEVEISFDAADTTMKFGALNPDLTMVDLIVQAAKQLALVEHHGLPPVETASTEVLAGTEGPDRREEAEQSTPAPSLEPFQKRPRPSYMKSRNGYGREASVGMRLMTLASVEAYSNGLVGTRGDHHSPGRGVDIVVWCPRQDSNLRHTV
jgi:hypothetical protein